MGKSVASEGTSIITAGCQGEYNLKTTTPEETLDVCGGGGAAVPSQNFALGRSGTSFICGVRPATVLATPRWTS